MNDLFMYDLRRFSIPVEVQISHSFAFGCSGGGAKYLSHEVMRQRLYFCIKIFPGAAVVFPPSTVACGQRLIHLYERPREFFFKIDSKLLTFGTQPSRKILSNLFREHCHAPVKEFRAIL